MTDAAYKLRFWGVRGSVPTPSVEKLRYGGNTSCLAVPLGGNEHLILDCGTGIRALGKSLAAGTSGAPLRCRVFITHYHLDHIEGLPFFGPMFDPNSAITFYGFESDGKSVREILQTLVSPPYFPVPLSEVAAKVDFVTLDGSPLAFGELGVSSLPLNHPNGSHAFRLERAGRRIVYATDHEHGEDDVDRTLVRFCEGADYLIYDATYGPVEYENRRRGWGHSTYFEGVRVARAAKVGTLVLFHHDPDHTDAQLEELLSQARQELPRTEIAREGMELPL